MGYTVQYLVQLTSCMEENDEREKHNISELPRALRLLCHSNSTNLITPGATQHSTRQSTGQGVHLDQVTLAVQSSHVSLSLNFWPVRSLYWSLFSSPPFCARLNFLTKMDRKNTTLRRYKLFTSSHTFWSQQAKMLAYTKYKYYVHVKNWAWSSSLGKFYQIVRN